MIGSAIIVIGLYAVLWGKYKEEQEQGAMKKVEELPQLAIRDNSVQVVNGNIQMMMRPNLDEANGSVALNLPSSHPPNQ